MDTRAADIVIDGRTIVTARPIASGPWPGAVMLHEGWGIDDVLRRFALLLSAEGYHAASVNYGPVPADIDKLAERACPIVASYGRDWMVRGVPPLREALRANGVPHDVEVYPAAGHAFLNDKPNGPLPFRPVVKLMRAGPEPVSAADAWRRIEAFFAEHLSS